MKKSTFSKAKPLCPVLVQVILHDEQIEEPEKLSPVKPKKQQDIEDCNSSESSQEEELRIKVRSNKKRPKFRIINKQEEDTFSQQAYLYQKALALPEKQILSESLLDKETKDI